jgi:hypothetical protein
VDDEQRGYEIEAQHLLPLSQINFTSGIGFYDLKQDLLLLTSAQTIEAGRDIDHLNLYTYARVQAPDPVVWTLGLSFDSFQEETFKRDDLNPKLGVEWQLHPICASGWLLSAP